MEIISIAKQKWIRSLHHKKYREKYGYFIGEGEKLFRELLTAPDWEVEFVLAPEKWLENNKSELAILKSAPQYAIPENDLKHVSALSTPQPPLVVLKRPDLTENIEKSLDQEVVLYLDGIRDPGNLGTILRIADWFGHRYILASADTVDWTNPKVIQASMGSFLRVKMIQDDLMALTEGPLSDRRVLGASMTGTALNQIEKQKSILVIGNESQGIRKELWPFIHEFVHIPGHGSAESLNAANAAAICCYQFFIA